MLNIKRAYVDTGTCATIRLKQISTQGCRSASGSHDIAFNIRVTELETKFSVLPSGVS